MIVKHLEDVSGTADEVGMETWTSRRLLLRRDGMGFSMHDTLIYAGTETHMWYQNHFEAVYCVEGEGEIEDLATGKKYPIRAGTLYALNAHDEHILRAKSQMRMVCVFNPPLTGQEKHDADGVYPLIEENEARAANS